MSECVHGVTAEHCQSCQELAEQQARHDAALAQLWAYHEGYIANTVSPLIAQVAELEAERDRLREALKDAAHRVRWFQQFAPLDDEPIQQELEKWAALAHPTEGQT